MKNNRGRPTKLTAEIQDEIIKAIKAGNYIETACALVGISKETLYYWLRRGAEAKRNNIYKQFSDAVKKAMAFAEARDVSIIGEAGKTNWQAAAWRLERKFPDKWGRRDALKVESKSEVKVERDDIFLDAETIPLAIALYRKLITKSAGEPDTICSESKQGDVDSIPASDIHDREISDGD